MISTVKRTQHTRGTPTKSVVRIVEIVIYNQKGQVLLLKRSSQNSIYVNKWQLPGGKVERGESARIAIAREVIEETACKVHALKLIKKFVYTQEFRGKKNTVELKVFTGNLSGQVRVSVDHTRAHYFAPKKITPAMLTPVSNHALFADHVLK